MAYVNGHPDWADISLNLETGHVFVQENWRYNWTVEPGAAPWTLNQRRNFHNTLDRQIWNVWSNRVKIKVAGAHPLVKRFPHGLPSLEFDVHWVVRGGHWTVNVRKMPPGSTPTTFRSNVDFPHNIINLDSLDLNERRAGNDADAVRDHFRSAPHEFGHSMPEAPRRPNHDEYVAGNTDLADTESVMNIGREIRARHLRGVLDELNRMVPTVTFSV